MGRRFERLTKKRRDEMLSAYIDGELRAEDRARLEAQMDADPVLRAELQALRRTVALVRDLPPQPLPRNFILPRVVVSRPRPAFAGRLRPKWIAPFLTVATAAVGFLFVFMLAGDLFLGGARRMAQLAAPGAAQEPVLVEKAVEREEGAPQELTAVDATKEESGDGAAGATALGTVGAEEVVLTAEPSPTSPPALAASPEGPGATGEEARGFTPEAEPSIPPTGGGADSGVSTPTAASTPVAEDTAVVTPPPMPEVEDTASATPLPVAKAPSPVPDLPPSPSPVPEPVPEPVPNGGEYTQSPSEAGEGDTGEGAWAAYPQTPLWRMVEVALGAAVLVLVAVTVWAWRVRRR